MKRRHSRAGLTMVELAAVMAVIAVVAGIVIGLARVVATKSDRARTTKELKFLEQAIDQYAAERGVVPPGPNFPVVDRTALTNYVSGLSFTDVWNNAYNYTRKGPQSYDLWSWGPDGVNNSGQGDDISNVQGP